MDLYFFDLDKTLYAYNFRQRLPALSRLTGVSQYRLASTWWGGGYEKRAEAGEWPTAEEYLDKFAEVTGARLTLDQWADARRQAMTRIPGSIAALERASTLGTVSLLSNNPSATAAALPSLIPDVIEIIGDNILVSFMLKARKPHPEIYERALAHFGVEASDAFLADDKAENIEGARSVGMHAHLLEWNDGVAQTDALDAAIDAFAERKQ